MQIFLVSWGLEVLVGLVGGLFHVIGSYLLSVAA